MNEYFNTNFIPSCSAIYQKEEELNNIYDNNSIYERVILSNKTNPYNAFSCQCKFNNNKEKGLLAGKKIVLKDTVQIQGMPMSMGLNC